MEEKEVIIKVEHLYKKFSRSLKRSLLYGSIDVLKGMLGIPYDPSILRKSEFYSLEDINFELRKGDSLGIIGSNGSGKSTLLRLLTGIFPPDKGKIEIKGKLGALIAVGAGFHPHLSGRDNIYLNATILGMSDKEIQEKFQKIVDFAEIGEFLDAPVSTYSSGMRVRLGFAIAIHCDPDILLIDEILSVGDLAFRNKSLRHMAEFRKRANALIFVSHDIEQIRNLCNRVIVINKGKLVYDGDTREGITVYEELSREERQNSLTKDFVSKISARDYQKIGDEVDIQEIKVVDDQGKETNYVHVHEGIKIRIKLRINKLVESLFFNLSVADSVDFKPLIYLVSNENQKSSFENLEPGEYELDLDIKKHNLNPNNYLLNISVRNEFSGEVYERIFTNNPITVKSDGIKLERGFIDVESSWEIKKI